MDRLCLATQTLQVLIHRISKLSAYLWKKRIEIMLIKLVFRLKVDYLVYYLGRYIPVSSEGFHLRFS